ncbi:MULTISPECIES: lysophospholipid acyltransferase family protein [unclassified Paenibacillus]|uniref:lysophospholipid acyltransferase family protein n=1 Tax=unclassified Paenibacillus TaxID=185978 RepID=UPI00020D66B0|nr:MULTISPECIES: lysophospholipid acyltransferase family protein [unclassified Paenibacillus]EGL17177.1 Acyltransferase [Paenibacillus sp. HGF7]EPD80753.1 1-acylglycerol-3-phosphate O-acyltransferase [Paenibacillus sp. HGH0039]
MSFYHFARGVCNVVYSLLFRIRVIGKDNIPEHGGVLLCSNHISNFDPPLVGIRLKRKVHFMAKAELFQIPVLGLIISKIGAFPVKRGGVSKETIKGTLNLLRDGNVLGIFPEGSRKNPGVGKKGAAMFALKSGAAVVPTAIIGDYKVFGRMTVIYGKPLDLTPFSEAGSADLEQVTEYIMQEIKTLIREHRKEVA